MANNAKNSDFITRTRNAASDVLESLSKLDGLRLEWDSLYNSIITEEDFDGTNSEVDLTVITAVMTTQAAIDSLMDSGHRTNLLKAE